LAKHPTENVIVLSSRNLTSEHWGVGRNIIPTKLLKHNSEAISKN